MGFAAEFIEEINALLLDGKAKQAAHRLQTVHRRRVPSHYLLPLAFAARRAGAPLLALRFLNPLVRPHGVQSKQATPAEKAEYSAALVRIGASSEALQLLVEIDARETPSALLYQAYAYFTQWRYADAIPLLRGYVGNSSLDDYTRVIGKLNLCAALVHERHIVETESLLKEVVNETRGARFHSLHGNALELQAQYAIEQRDWKKARDLLDRAENVLEHGNEVEKLFVHKWRAILELRKNRADAASVKSMERIRAKALALLHWETIREIDYHLAVELKSEALFFKVYFGSPFSTYRARLRADFTKPVAIPERYLWIFDSTAPEARSSIEICKGEKTLEGNRLKVGHLKHRLLRALVADFYRPLRLAPLFNFLHPLDFYHPVHSPARVYEAVSELREWFIETQLPFKVVENGGAYRLVATRKDVGLVVPSPDWWDNNRIDGLGRLREQQPTAPFSAQQATRLLEIPRRSLFHLLKKGIEQGELERLGSGSQTQYRFLPLKKASGK